MRIRELREALACGESEAVAWLEAMRVRVVAVDRWGRKWDQQEAEFAVRLAIDARTSEVRETSKRSNGMRRNAATILRGRDGLLEGQAE